MYVHYLQTHALYPHIFRYLRLKVAQSDHLPLWSSNHRHSVLALLPRAESVSNVVAILGDQTDVMFSFYRDGGGKDEARTIATGELETH